MKLTNISKSFGNRNILKNTTLEFPAGKTTVMVGPSGFGRSTILCSPNLLIIPGNDQYDFDDHHLDFSQEVSSKDKLTIRQETGVILQDYNPFPNRTVLGSITEGPAQVLRRTKKEAIANAYNLLARVGLADYGDTYPSELSGGQAQRVAVARALAIPPRYILLDEPTSTLDPELEFSTLKVLLQLAEEKRSVVIVTHSMIFTKHVADKIIFVENGGILYDGTPDKFFTPDNPNKRIKNLIALITMENLK